jgi:hypothetical protein
LQGSLSQLQSHNRVHEPLLRAIVEIPHDPAAGLVRLGDETGPGRRELIAAVGVGDGRFEQFSKLGHPLVGVCRW